MDALRPGAGQSVSVHLIGVAGSGMSGLAALCLAAGHRVSGSDRVRSEEIDRLEQMGLEFSSPHRAEVVEGRDAVVFSSAVKAGNPVWDAAQRLGLPLLRRAEALAALMEGKEGIVVAGTHGKTTTSALAAHVLREGGVRPSHYVGAEVPLLGANAVWDAAGKWFVAEGDESDGTLCLLRPQHVLLLNIEEDHVDFFSGLEALRELFTRFVSAVPGMTIYCAEDPVAAEVGRRCGGRGISYGLDAAADYSAGVLRAEPNQTEFTVMHRGEVLGRVELSIPGRHNVLNAMAVVALACELGVEFPAVARALATFRGARRRFERRYVGSAYTVIDDYGHHPTEVEATLKTARGQAPHRLVVVFQPHRYSRTARFAEEFARALTLADAVFVTEVYSAGECPVDGVSGAGIVDRIRELEPGKEAVFLPRKSEAHWTVGHALRPGDLLLTLGAGDIHVLASRLARDLELLEALEEVMGESRAAVRLYEPMRNRTTLRVGGPARIWIEPTTRDAFARAVRCARSNHLPVRVMGRGSNLLVRDGGIEGVVVHAAKGEFGEIRVRENRIEAGAGVRLKTLAAAAKVNGLGGFEWMEGIPGNVGGALRMNAGAMGVEAFDQVVSVRYFDSASGEVLEKPRKEFAYRYRSTPELAENFALSAVFEGYPDKRDGIQQRLNASQAKRRNSQPVGSSAGCIFKNPEGMSAGRLVEELGMKDERCGGAKVSEVHGNFIVNDSGATAAEVLELVERIRNRAWSEREIRLDTEVEIVGEEPPAFEAFVKP